MTAIHSGSTHFFDLKLFWCGAGPIVDYDTYSRAFRIEMDGKPPLSGSASPAFRGDAALYNPEDLLVAALSACHFLSYAALCAVQGVTVVAYEDVAHGTMAFDREHGVMRFTEVLLRPRVTIASPEEKAHAMELHEQAHHGCFIANSVNFPVRNEPTILVAGAR